MTHQNHQTNGASLEDCHTNFFALTDLSGIKWRKLIQGERPNASGDPLDDPVLRSYSRCLAADILCVWRRVAASKPDPDPSGFCDFGVGPGNTGTVTHPPLSLTAAKELWIFWYGDEPDLTNLVVPELIKSSEGEQQGAWETGLSYECRSLLFKALHNLIESCLLSRDVVRLGRWFVQPCSNNEKTSGKSSHHFSFSFAFFVHGDLTVCASMDLREHPPVRPLTPEYLAESVAQSQSNEGKPKPVILAPFGLAATLTGNSYRALDPASQKALNDWIAFYPLCNRDNSELPPIVEVVSGGIKMRYPSKYVLVTDIDAPDFSLEKFQDMSISMIGTDIVPPGNDLGNPFSMHIPQTAATLLPERVWQDCIANSPQSLLNNTQSSDDRSTSSSSSSSPSSSSSLVNTSTESNNNSTTQNNNFWEFQDPSHKMSCICVKCKKQTGRSTSSSSTSGWKSSSRSDKVGRVNRIPFHRRVNQNLNRIHTVSASSSSNSHKSTLTTGTSDSNSTATTTNIATTGSNSNDSVNLSTASQRSNTSIGNTTPHGGPPSNSRNPHSISESLPVPSVGSPASAGPSPLPHSTLSQPTSVPPSDQLLSGMSPLHPPSAPNIQPPTPNDNLDKNTPAPTPSDLHENINKSTTSSPYTQINSNNQNNSDVQTNQTTSGNVSSTGGSAVGTTSIATDQNSVLIKKEPAINNNNNNSNITNSSSNCNSNNISSNSNNSGNSNNNTSNNNLSNINNSNNNNYNHIVSILKRPVLSSRDYESLIDDDFLPRQLLYDYSTLTAWMNHPVKRYKPNEESKFQSKNIHDLYAGQPEYKPFSLVNTSINQTTSASSTAPISPTSSIIADPQIKQDPLALEGEQEQASPLLQAHEIKKEPVDAGAVVDKDGKCISGNLFTSEGLQVSFKDLDQIFDNSDDTSNDDTIQIHTPPGSNKSIGGHEDIKRCLNAGNPNTAILRPEELSKMFPTPPSLEHHPNSSPCGGGLFDNMAITDLAEGPKIKHEIYPNLGSPPNEPIEDWSYVFTPPAMNKFVGSSKYAPLTNLPSANLPPITLPANCVYKSTWKQQQQAQREQQQQQQQNNNQEKLQQSLSQATSNVNNNNNSSINNNRVSTPISSLSRPPSAPSIGGPNMLGPNNSMIHMNTLSGGQLIGNTNQTSQNNLGMFQGMSGSIRPGISPISPAQQSSQPFPGGVVGMTGSPMNHQLAFRRTPIPPPPPYDMAVASPATSTSSYLNKQFNSDEPPTTPSNNSSRVPEANALLVNVLLYDTSLNIFRDHNFDSCTLCVCNANPKYVGNIRGADSGVYLSLPGQTFNTQLQQQQQQNNNNLYNNNYDMYGNSGLDSPSMYSSNQNGFIDKDPIKCSCGFSAVVNRRLAHRSGLFYEDEMEITGMAEDPACYKKNSILSYILGRTSCINNNNNNNTNRKNNNNSSTNNVSIKLEPNSDECNENGELIPQQMMDLLREQCALVRTSSTSIHRAIQRFKSITTSQSLANRTLNVLEYSDAHEVINLALEQSRIVFETQNIYLTHNSKMNELENYNSNSGPNSSHRILSKSIVHKWPYLKVNGPKNNQDIIRIMKSMQPLLQNAFHSKSTTRLWDAPDTVKGPLTWRQFHRMAGRGIGQCEPQPIPTVIVGHEKDWLSIAPYAIQYWDKLLLEPYSYSRDVVYIVISPDNDFVASRIKTYFKELSTTYEMCKLGRHTPIKKWDGILRVSKTATLSSPNNTKPAQDQIDDWFSLIGDNKISEMLRTYAYACQQILVPYLAKIPNDKSLLDPPESTNSNSLGNSNRDRSLASPMRPPSTPDPSQSTLNSSDKAPSTPKSENDHDNQRDSLNNSQTTITTDPLSANDDEEKDPPSIVIYVVEPFTYGSDSSELQRLACLALLRCYSNILNAVPESIRSSINFQIISQESIMELSSNRNRIRFSDEMRCLALSVFSQCRRFLAHTNNIKSLTGFGTAANIEQFLKSKDDKNRHFYKLYTPPYILAAQHEKSENTESFGQINAEQQSSVMYCSYCLSEDQSWLLAVATDDRGELLETVTINIDIPNRSRRRKASARRLGLQKLMDFILGVISQSVQPWRLVIGRIGRIGHGELKGWSWLLSKQNLLKASKQLKDVCKQCSLMYPNAVPSLLSACLVTLEPDSTFRLMPDQFTPDERFSQISMQSPLSTPQDVTCTHILVFPTSAVSQSSQTTFQQINGLELNDDELFSVLGDDDGMVEGMETMNDIFETWVNGDVPIHQNSPERNSRQGSPLEENRFRQSPGAGGVNYGTNRSMGQDAEEVGAVLQQPLAVGYLVSTAPTGRMPSWFWSSCPHLENVSPVFLKTALHLHSPSIQNTDDLLSSNQQNNQAGNHPLDSTLTADVLRYVLEGYNVLSWLAMDSNTHDRLSCLPVHVQVLMQLYHMTAALA